MRILVVEHDDVLSAMLESCCQAQGFEVTCLCQGYAAVDLALHEPLPFDLVIVDGALEDLGAADLIRAVSRVLPGQPYLLLASVEEAPGLMADLPAEVDVLPKPVDFSLLVEALRKVKERGVGRPPEAGEGAGDAPPPGEAS